MFKLDNLRATLAAALPVLQAEPDRLQIFCDEGAVACTAVAAGGLSWEYRYKAHVVLLDFAESVDVAMLAILDFIQRQQPDLLLNHDRNKQAIAFEADILSDAKVDLSLRLPLTERVRVTPRDGGGFDIAHVAEPAAEPTWSATSWEIWVDGEKIAAWDVEA